MSKKYSRVQCRLFPSSLVRWRLIRCSTTCEWTNATCISLFSRSLEIFKDSNSAFFYNFVEAFHFATTFLTYFSSCYRFPTIQRCILDAEIPLSFSNISFPIIYFSWTLKGTRRWTVIKGFNWSHSWLVKLQQVWLQQDKCIIVLPSYLRGESDHVIWVPPFSNLGMGNDLGITKVL